MWPAVGLASAIALIAGGIVAGVIGSSSTGNNRAAAVPTVIVEAQPPQFNPTIPVSPDPVCAEWAPIADANAAKQREWSDKSVDQPAATWNAEQRDLNRAFI
jgi:hypothetical protein